MTAFVGLWDTETGTFEQYMEFLVNPGIPIPEEASNVHGITDEVAARGMDPVEALEIMFYILHDWAEYPLVVMNAPYDLTLINAELARYGYTPFDWNKRHVIDPLTIDRAKDRYRKGKKNLTRLAEVYGVPHDADSAHDAAYDCYLAVNVALKQIEKWGTPSNEDQAEYHQEWAEGFESWLRNAKGDPTIEISRQWPYATLSEDAAEGAAEKEE